MMGSWERGTTGPLVKVTETEMNKFSVEYQDGTKVSFKVIEAAGRVIRELNQKWTEKRWIDT